MKKIFSQISLKRVFSLFTFATIGLLVLVILLAGKQYLLYRQCDKLVDSSQHLLFQFTGIKEHINETLLQDKTLNNAEIIKEIQTLDSDLTLILEDVLIPEEFKLTFISQVDLVNLTVTLRNIQNDDKATGSEYPAKLTTQLRQIHSKLTAFNQLITRYTQKQLLGLHRALVGLLAIIIAMVSIMLMVINQYITSPIIHYCRAIFPEEKDTISLFTLHKSIENMATQQPQEKSVQPNKKNIAELSRLYRNSSIGNMFGGISNELTNRSNGIINYTQALLDLSDDLQLDHDTKTLLQKLFIEEKKMAELLTHMIQFTGGSDNGMAKSLSLDDIFSHIDTLVQGTLKNDRINLLVTLDDPARTLNYHVNDLQLVILSALQNSRIALKRKDTETTEEMQKQIDISVDDISSTEKISITIRDNGSPWELNSTQMASVSDRPWHNMHFCHDFLQTFNGELHVTREPDKSNLCVIEIPLHDKKDNA